MGKKSNITDEQLQKMIKLYSKGMTIKDIGEKLDLSYNVVSYQLRKAGKIIPTCNRKKYSVEDKQKAKQLLGQGKSYQEVSYLTGMNIFWLRNKLPRHKFSNSKPRKVILKYHGKSIPCNIIDCNDRKNCKDKNNPQDCLVWQLVYGKK